MRVFDVEEHWFDELLRETKTVEGRKASPTWVDIIPGEPVKFRCKETSREALFEVVRVTIYDSLEDYIACEGLRHCLPGVTTLEEGIKIYQGFFTSEELQRYKLLAIEVRLVKDGTGRYRSLSEGSIRM